MSFVWLFSGLSGVGARLKTIFVVVGRFPPPLGGVSIFVKRKYAALRRNGAEFVDVGVTAWPLKLLGLRLRGGRVFLLNTGNVFFLSVCWVFGVLSSAYIYDHNASRSSWGRGWKERLYVFLVQRARGVRVVHEHLRLGYETRGLGHLVEVESPFIPPDDSESIDIKRGYSSSLKAFLGKPTGFRIVLSASKYAVDPLGRDIYGLDSLVALLSFLCAKSIDFTCLLAIAELDESKLPMSLKERIQDLVNEGCLVVVSEKNELWPIYRDVDLFLRLTSTDGESVSVREALYFGCEVVASDVVPRPSGVRLYKYGEQSLLNEIVLSIVEKRPGASVVA